MQRDASPRHDDERVRRPGEREVGAVGELEPARDPAAGQQHDLAVASRSDPLAVRAGQDHFLKPRMILTSSATTSGLSARSGFGGITLLLPTDSPPPTIVFAICSSVTDACHAGSV